MKHNARIKTSPGFGELLANAGGCIAVSSYQSGQVYFIGNYDNDRVQLNRSHFRNPKGLCWAGEGKIVLADEAEILEITDQLRPSERYKENRDGLFIPRKCHFTGSLDVHDINVDADGRIVFVNTRFNCLAMISERFSFEAIWQPKFVRDLVAEDRCHLNGLAMREGQPKYVTAFSSSNRIEGWRDNHIGHGLVIDVQNDRTICQKLTMPHSPRWHDGQLWVLNSGTGEGGVVEDMDRSDEGVFVPRFFCPGFLRGLSFGGGYAFVTISKPRHARFKDLPLGDALVTSNNEPQCGVQVVDLESCQSVGWLRFEDGIEELYDVAFIPDYSMPAGVSHKDATLQDLVVWDQVPHNEIAPIEKKVVIRRVSPQESR